MDHEEIICHATGERRQNYLNQIRCILEQMDDTPCVRRTGHGSGQRKPLIEFPGYVNQKRAYETGKKILTMPPLITNIPVKELRPTSEYSKHQKENDENLEYYQVDARYGLTERKKSFEMIGGTVISGCECPRRNGLQDKCRRTGCRANPNCRTEPPSCGPSSTYPMQTEVPLELKFQQAINEHPPMKKHYCCCDPNSHGSMDPRGLPQGFAAFPCNHH